MRSTKCNGVDHFIIIVKGGKASGTQWSTADECSTCGIGQIRH